MSTWEKWAAVVFCAVAIVGAAGIIIYRYEKEVPKRNGEPIPVSSVTRERVARTVAAMGEWVIANQDSTGALPYVYRVDEEEFSDGDNVIRQMITAQGLYAAGRVFEDARMTSAAERVSARAFEESYVYDTARRVGYMREDNGEVKLGAAALAVLALREKDARAPVSEKERALGDFIISMQREDGSFQTFLQDERTDENDRFYSGEALTALALLHRASGEKKYRAALERGFTYYRALLEREFMPQYAPWHSMAYTIFYEDTRRTDYAEYVFYLTDALVEGMLDADVDAKPDEIGRFFNPLEPTWGPPHSSSTGIYTEGLTYAYDTAVIAGDAARLERYRAAVVLGTRSLMQVQWTPESAAGHRDPERLIGALRETVTNGDLRIDQTGHALNALARAYEVLESI